MLKLITEILSVPLSSRPFVPLLPFCALYDKLCPLMPSWFREMIRLPIPIFIYIKGIEFAVKKSFRL